MSDYYPSPEYVFPLFRSAKKTDGQTSKAGEARAVAFRGAHAEKIRIALTAGPAGQTAIARRTRLTVAQVSKRMHELRKEGAIERTGRKVADGEDEYRRCEP